MENGAPKTEDDASSKRDLLTSLDRWKQYLVAAAAILTVAAQLWSAVENQWKLASVTLILAVIIATLYLISHRVSIGSPQMNAALRFAMILLLVAIPICSLVGLGAYSYLPRLAEGDTTTIAVAEFSGPPLPEPYKDCRPSDMLVHTLTKVGGRFGGVRAFELPYSIDPGNRWATSWAQFHGTFEAADVIVYGEYIPYQSGTAANGQSDELVINPEVTRIPSVPLGFTSAPLYGWSFTGSVAKIQELCGSDLRDAGFAPRFLDDSRRVASAIAGLRALGRQDFEIAQEAAKEAKRSEITKLQPCSVNPVKKAEASNIERDSLCPAVLAFYLATLDARLGNLDAAIDEYAYAAPKLGTSASFINLGELYVRVGDPNAAFEAFDRAIDADPQSVAAWATRAELERDYLRPQQAWIDLKEAMKLRQRNYQGPFDDIALSFAIHQLGGKAYAACGIASLRKVLYPAWFYRQPDQQAGVEALVRYGVWLNGAHDYPGAITDLREAINRYPEDVQGNYVLGMAYEQSKPPSRDEAESFLRRAEYAPAYTDEDYLYEANAAYELVRHFDQNPEDVKDDLQRAKDAYGQSIKKNRGAAYAYYGRSILERRTNSRQARADLEMAAQFHPDDALIQSALAQFLDSINQKKEGAAYHQRAAYIADSRISKREAEAWNMQTCRYKNLD
jgi:tetratricopeptide (TPR) repeat protein